MSEVKIPPDDPPEIASAHREGSESAALGRDPFDDWEGPDPFVERLDQLESRRPVVTPARQARLPW